MTINFILCIIIGLIDVGVLLMGISIGCSIQREIDNHRTESLLSEDKLLELEKFRWTHKADYVIEEEKTDE